MPSRTPAASVLTVENLRSPKPDGSASAFLVERYLPVSAAGDLAASVAHVARIVPSGGTFRRRTTAGSLFVQKGSRGFSISMPSPALTS
jgi:hypothetical protein